MNYLLTYEQLTYASNKIQNKLYLVSANDQAFIYPHEVGIIAIFLV